MVLAGLFYLWPGRTAFGGQQPAQEETVDDKRRRLLSDYAKEQFAKDDDRCRAFTLVVERAASSSANLSLMIDDLLAVFIGKALDRKDRGPYYFGRFEGAKGFKPELADRSPQVEHAFAAIYIGARYPPGTTEAVNARTELLAWTEGEGVNWADVQLYLVGGDIGARLTKNNYRELPGVIRRTICK